MDALKTGSRMRWMDMFTAENAHVDATALVIVRTEEDVRAISPLVSVPPSGTCYDRGSALRLKWVLIDGAPLPKIIRIWSFFLRRNFRCIPRPWDVSSGLRQFYFCPNSFGLRRSCLELLKRGTPENKTWHPSIVARVVNRLPSC